MTTDAELIAAAVSAGKVTVVPAAKANGAAPAASQTKAATRPARKVTKAKKAEPKAKPAKRELPKGMTSASAIAAELGMTPKALRAILRRKMGKPTDGWVFDAKTATKVRGLVKKAA